MMIWTDSIELHAQCLEKIESAVSRNIENLLKQPEKGLMIQSGFEKEG